MMKQTAVIAGLLAAIAAAAVAIAAVDPQAAPAPVRAGPPANVAMVPTFAEEFAGSAIDRDKWNLAYGPRVRGSPPVGSRSLWGNGEAEIYFDRDYLKLGIDPFSVGNGVLTITARPLSATARDAVFGDAAKYPGLITPGRLPRVEYSSGAITTRDRFAQRYGYFEIRAAFSAGRGRWPAFWLLPANGAWPPEIDVVEAHGDKLGSAFHTIHSSVAARAGFTAPVTGAPEGFHTYGALWVPGRVDFYIDGRKTGTLPETADMTQPMYLLANLAIGGNWPGYPDPDPKFSATMKIDYIRVWQFRDRLSPSAQRGAMPPGDRKPD